MERQTFIAKKIEIAGGDFTIYLDRRLAPDSAIQYRNFPQQMLMIFPVPVAVGSIELKHINISYEEFQKNGNLQSILTLETSGLMNVRF